MSCKGLKGVKLAQCKKRYERNAAAGLKRTGKPSFHKTHPKGWTKNQSDFSKKYEKMNSESGFLLQLAVELFSLSPY